MRRIFKFSIALAIALAQTSEIGLADEGIFPLAESGDWVAVAHHASSIDPPDMCAVSAGVENGRNFILRVDQETLKMNMVEIRVADKSWALPADVKGQITLTVGKWTQNFDVVENTDDRLDTLASKDVFLTMVSAMDHSSTMLVSVGKKTFNVSLVGSTRVTNAFMTCAGIKSNASQTPDSNPFN